MRFFKLISVITVISILSCAGNTTRAAFTDVTGASRNATAIAYLSKAGIIGGYPDGSFHPGNNVNRAEFLKLALESSGITTDTISLTGFRDVDESAWYAKYVRKAYKEGWVEGYGDGTFRPENPITKAEGLKMIGEIQGWDTPPLTSAGPFGDTPAGQWFTPCISYAKTHNFLEESGKFFIPDALFTREKTAEVLFRTHVTKLTGSENYTSKLALTDPPAPIRPAPVQIQEETPVKETSAQTAFTPVKFSEYPTDFFQSVILLETFPNTFYLNELYYFEGTTSKSGEKAFVFLMPENEIDRSKYTNYVATAINGKFRIPVYFEKTGNYRLGLIPGTTGESNVLNISVLQSLPVSTATNGNPSPSAPQISYSKGDSTVNWNSNDNGLIKVKVTQGTKSKNFIFRQNISSFHVPFTAFEGFGEGATSITVEGASLSSKKPLAVSSGWKISDATSFSATTHNFTENDDTGLTINSLPETYYDSQTISFSGIAKSELYADAAVTRPDGSVEMIRLASTLPYGEYFSSQTIPSGSVFTFRYRPSSANGTYFIEINRSNGEAALNYPVYLKSRIPLIPDFADLATNRITQNEDPDGLDDKRTKLLGLINADRTSAGLKAVKADVSLINLAQLHSEDMVNRNFFGHVNPDNQAPDDRRIESGIQTPVGENLAQAPTISYAHNGLMRSGIHRKNILNPAWTRVGIGIALDMKKNFFITEEFSDDPLTEIDLANLENEILQKINARRADLGQTAFTRDSILSQIADEWSENMATHDFFDFISPDGDSLNGAVRAKIPERAIQAQILESLDFEQLAREILDTIDASFNSWSTLGIGFKINNIGVIKATLLYST